jgi:N-acetyl-anhydromuramyl-L-alanine amidase AmpD
MANLWKSIFGWLRNSGSQLPNGLREFHIPNPDKDTWRQVKPKYKEVFRQSPNVSRGRVITPKAIVLHHTSGNYAGSVAWCLNPNSQVSYHCIVKRDGDRTVLALDNQRAWHAGISNWKGRPDLNSWSLGLAFEGDTNKEPLSEDMINSAIEYLVPRMKELSLTIGDVTDHRTVSPGRKNDLKLSEYDRFMQALKKNLQ